MNEKAHDHYPDEASTTHLVHITIRSLGHFGRATYYACADCVTETLLDAIDRPDYFGHAVSVRSEAEAADIAAAYQPAPATSGVRA